MNTESGKTTKGLLIGLVIALALVWLISLAIERQEDMQYLLDNGGEIEMTQERENVEELAETSESTDVSDLEADLNFDADAALDLDDFEVEN